jgi:hypothetical protein
MNAIQTASQDNLVETYSLLRRSIARIRREGIDMAIYDPDSWTTGPRCYLGIIFAEKPRRNEENFYTLKVLAEGALDFIATSAYGARTALSYGFYRPRNKDAALDLFEKAAAQVWAGIDMEHRAGLSGPAREISVQPIETPTRAPKERPEPAEPSEPAVEPAQPVERELVPA